MSPEDAPVNSNTSRDGTLLELARTVSLLLSAQHSADLQVVIEDRGRPVKHVQRAQIVLLSAERLPVLKIARRVGISRPMV